MSGSALACFGGTFDPVHYGHLILAERVVDTLGLDRLAFVPCGVPPHKDAGTVAGGEHRLAMLDLAIAGNARFSVSDVELREPGASYTIRTVRRLKEEGAGSVLLVVGADSLVELDTWMEPEALLRESRLVAVARPGVDLAGVAPRYRDRVTLIESPLIDLSSTEIRARVRHRRSIRYLTPPAVVDYIRRHGLYA